MLNLILKSVFALSMAVIGGALIFYALVGAICLHVNHKIDYPTYNCDINLKEGNMMWCGTYNE